VSSRRRCEYSDAIASTLTTLSQEDNGVNVVFLRWFDMYVLVVRADGIHSSIRQLAFCGTPFVSIWQCAARAPERFRNWPAIRT
jgi:2-polyprenyl-6-methoxyphenol hydroxylase-like FAD-dependent oxidoreductase